MIMAMMRSEWYLTVERRILSGTDDRDFEDIAA